MSEEFEYRVDDSTGQIMVLDYVHHEIHAGKTFIIWDSSIDIDTTPIRIKIDIPAQGPRLHMLVTINVSGLCTYTMTENPTGGATGGAAFTPINARRDSSNVSSVTVTTGVTAPTGGTQILGPFSFGDKGISASSRDDGEWVLGASDTAQSYIFEIVGSANGIVGNFIGRWYEHTDRVEIT